MCYVRVLVYLFMDLTVLLLKQHCLQCQKQLSVIGSQSYSHLHIFVFLLLDMVQTSDMVSCESQRTLDLQEIRLH